MILIQNYYNSTNNDLRTLTFAFRPGIMIVGGGAAAGVAPGPWTDRRCGMKGFEVAWREINRKGEFVIKRAAFKNAADRFRFVLHLEKRPESG